MSSMSPTDITNLRRRAGLTQSEFADMLGVTQATVSYWESGRHYPREVQLAMLQRLGEQLTAYERENKAQAYEAMLKGALGFGVVAVLALLFSNDE